MLGFKYDIIKARTKEVAHLMILHQCTIRKCASMLGVSKSTVYNDIHIILKKDDLPLYCEVRKVIEINLRERAYRGGESIRLKKKGGISNENNVCH